MSRANVGPGGGGGERRGSSAQQNRREGGVGGSVFGLANNVGGPPGGRTGRPPRALQPFGQPPQSIPAPDFDFQKSNAAFNKETAVEDDVIIPPAPPENYYNKKASFFDSISSDIKPGNNISVGRFDRGAERSKNMDTFGESGGNGGGFGGRGRGRGRGRGGFGNGGPRRGGGGVGVVSLPLSIFFF